jgi:phospholipid transport system substrate-binding protein
MGSRIARPGLRAWSAKLCTALLVMAATLAQPAAAALDPQDVVRSFYGILLSNMKEGGVLGESGRFSRLAPVIDRSFDIPAMTRSAIGPSWANFTAAQQQQLIAAFGHYVAATYADQFQTYSGEQLQVIGERPHGADVIVETRIVQPRGNVRRLDYLMRQDQFGPRISDVYLDGTISQLAVYRSEFSSILQREGVDGLVVTLNRKVDLFRNTAKTS